MLFSDDLVAKNPLRQTMRDFYRADEEHVLEYLLPIAEVGDAARSRAWDRARNLVVNIRKEQVGKGGVDALLNEFSLSTEEGVVLMCLAEALLRVPDKITADRLIRDKLSEGNWSSHLGNSDSVFVNASAWGLLMTGKMVTYNDKKKAAQMNLLKKTMGRLGEPVIRRAMRYAMQIMGTQFVMGTNILEALKRAVDMEAKGYRYSYDMLGEGARTMTDANRYFESYLSAIEAIGKAANGRGPINSPGISVKLSAIHPRYEFSHRDRVVSELIPQVKKLALAAKKYDIGLTIDAEEADRLDISLDIIEAVFSDNDIGDWQGFGIAVQAYQKRGIHVIEWIKELCEKVGRRMMVRLVKGAYWDTEVKISQVEGVLDYPVFTRKPATDVSYQACAKKLLEYREFIYPQFATHNAYTVATILEIDKSRDGYEFQRLHGMGDSLYDQVITKEKVPVRVYAPVGEHADLLAYLVRRLLENGANTSFVNNIVDEKISVESLLTDPVELVRSWPSKRNRQIPLPEDIYGDDRKNSLGVDLTDINDITPMRKNMIQWWNKQQQTPIIENGKAVVNPANHKEIVGYIKHLTQEQLHGSIEKASSAFSDWTKTSPEQRAQILLNIGATLESHRDELLALCTKEAGKTTLDGVAEVREAVDFCRYYATQSQHLFNGSDLESLGVVLCISPWNFPLAIFLGQVTAALAAGNTVLAKPAEQTTLIAQRAVELMVEAGLPENAVQLLVARGRDVGENIIPDERVKAVMFTGSTATASWISQTLAKREGMPVPLIAETGGQNCMIVDSTALPEQVVDDVIASGFQSAGQRCSALRVLFLQEEVADKIINMIKGAMMELHVGDPAYFSTDVGPVIDTPALNSLNEHIDYLETHGRKHYRCEQPQGDGHNFFGPSLYEISNLSILKDEVFGPIVHVIRYSANNLDDVINQINGTGYGLTMGVHSRIQDMTMEVASKVQAGNIYINRNMIGAVVGVQPFGGRGLSGTGPKAGGPHYLSRLVKSIHHPMTPSIKDTPAKADPASLQHANETTGYALEAYQTWSQKTISDRTSVLRQFIARVASNEVLKAQESDLDDVLSTARKYLKKSETLLEKPIELPGPTGESNRLVLESRGPIVSIRNQQTTFENWLISSLLALASGNTLIVVVDENNQQEVEACQSALVHSGLSENGFIVTTFDKVDAFVNATAITGVIVDPASQLDTWCQQTISARDGIILPLISGPVNDQLLFRMITEKTITIDTTAAGGNASLMTMADNAA